MIRFSFLDAEPLKKRFFSFIFPFYKSLFFLFFSHIYFFFQIFLSFNFNIVQPIYFWYINGSANDLFLCFIKHIILYRRFWDIQNVCKTSLKRPGRSLFSLILFGDIERDTPSRSLSSKGGVTDFLTSWQRSRFTLTV